MKHGSCYMSGRNIIPERLPFKPSYKSLIYYYASTSIQARNLADGAHLLQRMIDEGDTIWLGIAGVGIAGGMGGIVMELIERGHIDVICSTGAQVYHDLHFAFGLPVKQGSPHVDDNDLRDKNVTRIYDIYIDEERTLKAQDEIIRNFCRTLKRRNFSSPDFNYELGKFVLENARYPERSFVATAAKHGVPIFWDSTANHSIAMNIAAMSLEGINIHVDANRDILESAAIVLSSKATGFVELGGGGPKNFIQQTSPTISQILNIDFEGADRGLQITTDQETNAGLSGCTFKEGVSWGKYKNADVGLVQIISEYSTVFPLIAGYAMEACKTRNLKNIIKHKKEMYEKLTQAVKAA